MKEMNEQQAIKWRKRRTLGKGKYVIMGLLSCGITSAALFTAMEWLTQQTFTISWLYIRLVVFGFIGFIVFAQIWERSEHKYKAYLVEKGAAE